MSIKWSDIKSETMSMDEYLKEFENNKYIINNYENYIPKSKHLAHLGGFMEEISKGLRIFVMGAEWCPDSSEQIPSMIKIIKVLKSDNIQMRILYGIKINSLRKNGEILWNKNTSPPEAVDPKFDLVAIPTFYFFIDDEYV
ncbi:MAG: thioredoxin family protein, partial [Promethearchaeota archaeon]